MRGEGKGRVGKEREGKEKISNTLLYYNTQYKRKKQIARYKQVAQVRIVEFPY